MNAPNRPATTVARMSHSAVIGLVALVAVACTEPSSVTPVGAMLVSVHITGAPDDNGFGIVVDATMPRSLTTNVPTVTIYELKSGPHTVQLVRLPGNCTATDSSLRRVTIESKQTTPVTFDVQCRLVGIAVTTRTTGEDTVRAYKFVIRDSIVARPGANDSVVVGHLNGEMFNASLVVPLDNCTVASPNPLSVRVPAHTLVTLHFDVVCGARVRVAKIAYVTDTAVDGRPGTWIAQVNVDGSKGERLEPGEAPSWSPDGTKLVYSKAACQYDFYHYFYDCSGGLMTLDVERWSTVEWPLTMSALTPAWAPHDDRVAFTSCCLVSNNGLIVARFAGGMINLGTAFAKLIGYTDPAWSPDGTRIAFSCLVLNRNSVWDICIIPATGGDVTALTRRSGDEASRSFPAWSPDGTHIAFAASGLKISIYSLETGEVTVIGEGTEPAWSPDGKMLAIVQQDGLFVINADGTNLRRLTRGPHSDPVWRP